MTSEIDWDEDLPADAEEEYQAFLRTLERTEGFRLLFVQCTPVEGKELITKVKENLNKKTIEVLEFDEPIDNLYEIVKHLPNREQINILFIQGLEHSLYEYEQTKFGEKSERFAYSWKGVPKILNHLNLHRERFRDSFNICFVFLLRCFSLKYFIHRAPDFFDWRSSIFEFPTKPELLEQESSRLIEEGDYERYRSLTAEEKIKKILEIEELLEEKHQTLDKKAELLREQGRIFDAAQKYKLAILAYDKAIEIKPDYDLVWVKRGNVLRELGRLEEAIASYDKAIKIKPNYRQAWVNRGNLLRELGRLEEAIASYDKAIEIRPNYRYALVNKGIALGLIGNFNQAITFFDKALEIKADNASAFYNKACCYALQNNIGQAIENLQITISLNPEKYREMAKTDNNFDAIRNHERFQELIHNA